MIAKVAVKNIGEAQLMLRVMKWPDGMYVLEFGMYDHLLLKICWLVTIQYPFMSM